MGGAGIQNMDLSCLVTASKPIKKKRKAADEKPMNNENKKAARRKGTGKNNR